jgi:hypothetical protein
MSAQEFPVVGEHPAFISPARNRDIELLAVNSRERSGCGDEEN